MKSYEDIIEALIERELQSSDVLAEFFLGPSTSTIQVHDTLNPKLWTHNNRLLPEVRNVLLKIADEFLFASKCKEKPQVLDIILTGSNANYNYSNVSDLDLHIVIDPTKFTTMEPENVMEFYGKARVLWNLKRNLSIRGIKVEVFVEDLNTPRGTGGVFSIKKNTWLIKPVRFDLNKRDPRVKKIVRRWVKDIKAAIASGDGSVMLKCFKTMRDERRQGIEQGEGESSPENMAFKIIRNGSKWIDKLFTAMDAARDAKLSISEEAELQEFVMPIIGTPNVKLHKKLHPDLWDGETLKPEVREKLLKIAKAFMGFIGKRFVIRDIRFKGSMANFNYTKSSDIDVHIIADVTPEDEQLIQHARIAWKQKYKVSIFGYPVELGIDRPDKLHTSSAVYSLMKNKWIDKPTGQRPDIDLRKVQALYKMWKAKLDAAMKTRDLKVIKKVEQDIRGERDKALMGHRSPKQRWAMEMSEINLAFKRLRDTGVFDRIRDMAERNRERDLSLDKSTRPFGL